MKILIINGPNLNMLGKRDPDKYGLVTLQKIIKNLNDQAVKLGCKLKFFQSNHEGDIIDFLQKDSSRKADGVLINPGALIRYAYSLRQAMVDFDKPFIEVHMSGINKTGVNKKINVLEDVPKRIEQIIGLKENSYYVGLEKLTDYIKQEYDQ